ncbi:hypothetical protein EG329_003865 [Mollisiaceae sp. DMI_Dod_QoI]|nr:hypothetical protein EG329_003865 [Helotiales sp. DMI_Dod_QoI]
MPKTYLIVGASRGIGLELTRQLLSHGHTVLATCRAPTSTPPGNASKLWSLTGSPNGHNLAILECDVSIPESVKAFTEEVRKLGREGCVLEQGVIDVVVLNAGVLDYPNRISEVSFPAFTHHIQTNTIGPLLTASSLLSLSSPSSPQFPPPSHFPSPFPSPSHQPKSPTTPLLPTIPIQIHTLAFISSDSGSASRFLSYEDGFGAYSVSKAALNQGLRHLACELQRQVQTQTQHQDIGEFPSSSSSSGPGSGGQSGVGGSGLGIRSEKGKREASKAPVVLAIHPGEVATDMASGVGTDLAWEIEGIIGVEESVRGVLGVIEEKGWGGVDEGGGNGKGEAMFWDWRGGVYPW